jgi:cytochrome c
VNPKTLVAIGFVVAAIAATDPARAEGDWARGQQLYEQRCFACHSLDANRVGPMHRGVYGRKAGSVAGYNYSPAVRNAAIVWDQTTLDKWLTNPQDLIPGQRMNFRVSQAEDRADIIAFLKRESGR